MPRFRAGDDGIEHRSCADRDCILHRQVRTGREARAAAEQQEAQDRQKTGMKTQGHSRGLRSSWAPLKIHGFKRGE
jgi:hypothetical protein